MVHEDMLEFANKHNVNMNFWGIQPRLKGLLSIIDNQFLATVFVPVYTRELYYALRPAVFDAVMKDRSFNDKKAVKEAEAVENEFVKKFKFFVG